MRRIFRPRNLLLAALLAGAGAAVIAWRRTQSGETAWSEIHRAENEEMATVSRLESPSAGGARETETEAEPVREMAATLHATDPAETAGETESTEEADIETALDLGNEEGSSL